MEFAETFGRKRCSCFPIPAYGWKLHRYQFCFVGVSTITSCQDKCSSKPSGSASRLLERTLCKRLLTSCGFYALEFCNKCGYLLFCMKVIRALVLCLVPEVAVPVQRFIIGSEKLRDTQLFCQGKYASSTPQETLGNRGCGRDVTRAC